MEGELTTEKDGRLASDLPYLVLGSVEALLGVVEGARGGALFAIVLCVDFLHEFAEFLVELRFVDEFVHVVT